MTCLPYFEANLSVLMPNARPSETSTAGITPDHVPLPLTYCVLCARWTGMPPIAVPTMLSSGAYDGASSLAHSPPIEPPE